VARQIRRAGNLPAETSSFIGRQRELGEVRAKLSKARLVSLVGPGGVGKTRLAIRAAAGHVRGFRDGGWLAELAEVPDPGLVDSAVLSALDLHDQSVVEPRALLLSYLRDRELLLVVDNCEHLLEGAARLVGDVLRAAPGVRVIATSREPLSVPGEHVVPVPPLRLPPPRAVGQLAELAQNESVMLFTERAVAASGTFELTAGNQGVVADLCRRLDGLPLAVELAAVRTRALTAEQILARLTDRFGLLADPSRAAVPRHRTLQVTIEWSYDLLPDEERTVLRRCCVFAGRFTLEDAESVCMPAGTPSARALDLLSSLVDKSLVTREDARGAACYRLHETMREFAGLKLAEAGEADAVEHRCAEYYRSACRTPAGERRYRLAERLPWFDLEIDNIRAVLQRCVNRGDHALGIDLAASLSWYWITRATTEGVRWLDVFLAGGGGAPPLRAWAWFIRGFLGVLKAEPEAAGPALRAAVAAARETGQHDLLSEALAMAAIAEGLGGDYAQAGRLLDEADAVASGLDYPPGKLAVLQARTLRGFFSADVGTARASATAGLRLARETGDTYGLEMMLLNLGSAALIAGDLEESGPLLTEALRVADQIDDRVAQQHLLGALGCQAAFRGRARLAAQLLGAADTARAEVGANVMPFLAPSLAAAAQAAAAALGATRFQAERENGKRLAPDEAIGRALGEGPRDTATASGNVADSGDATEPLTKREADVARLLADGLTNRQIGTRLFISERTVDSHVRSILNKLGFASRAQIAAWVAALDR